MKKLTKVLNINEKDGLLGALGKGMLQGTIKSALVCTAIGLSAVIADRLTKKEISEEEVGE